MKAIVSVLMLLLAAGVYGQISLSAFEAPNYGPFLENGEDDFAFEIVNDGGIQVDAKVHVKVNRFGSTLMETDMALLPVIQVLPLNSADYQLFDGNGSAPFIFYNQAFKDSLDSFMVPIRANCTVVATLHYNSGEGYTQGNQISEQVYDVPPDTIEHVFPRPNDTLYTGSKVITFRWDDLPLVPHYTTQYELRVYEVGPGQTASQALLNAPVLDKVIETACSYRWLRGGGIDTIIHDSVYSYHRHYVWTVANIIPDGFNAGFYNNQEVNEFHTDNIPFPHFVQNGDTLDSLEFYSYAYGKGFDKGLIDERGWDTPIPATGPKVYPSYKNLSCQNGGVEDDNFRGWTGAVGVHNFERRARQIVLDQPGIQYDPNDRQGSQHYIFDYSVAQEKIDEYIPTMRTVSPRGGDHSIRIGNEFLTGRNAVLLEYEFTVNSQNQDFQFLYALVMQDPRDGFLGPDENHKPGELPFFFYRLQNVTDDELVTELEVVSDEDSEGFFERHTEVISNEERTFVYHDWDCVGVDLSTYLGKQMKISFMVADCSLRGHLCYAYIDGLCESYGPIPEFAVDTAFCVEDTIIADGSATLYEMDYRWAIEESDQWWGRNTETQVYSKWYRGQEVPDDFSITELLDKLGIGLKCDQYYRLTLYVGNNCDDYEDKTRLIYIKPCFKADAGPDHSVCFDETELQLIGTVYNSPYPTGYGQTTFAWSHDSILTYPYDSVLPNNTQTYTLSATLSGSGCTTTDETTVYLQNGLSYGMQLVDEYYCNDEAMLCVELYSFGEHRLVLNHVNGGGSLDEDVIGMGKFCYEDITFDGPGRRSYELYVENACTTKSTPFTFHNFNDGFTINPKSAGVKFSFYGRGSTFLNPRGDTSYPDYVKEFYIWDGHNFEEDELWPPSPIYSYAYSSYAARLEFFARWGNAADQKKPIWVNVFTPQYGMGLYNPQVNYDLMYGGELLPSFTYDFSLWLNPCGPVAGETLDDTDAWFEKRFHIWVFRSPGFPRPRQWVKVESTLIGIKVD